MTKKVLLVLLFVIGCVGNVQACPLCDPWTVPGFFKYIPGWPSYFYEMSRAVFDYVAMGPEARIIGPISDGISAWMGFLGIC